MLTTETRKKLAIAYIILLVFGVFYVKNVLKVVGVKVMEQQKDKETIEVHPVKVTLEVSFQNKKVSKAYNLTNRDTVLSLLNEARTDKLIYYENTAFINKSEIKMLEIGDFKIPMDQQTNWQIFKITPSARTIIEPSDYNKTMLEDYVQYELVR